MEDVLMCLLITVIIALAIFGVLTLLDDSIEKSYAKECVFQGYMGAVVWDKQIYCIRYNSDLVAEIAPLDE